jgi:hypothetical protein
MEPRPLPKLEPGDRLLSDDQARRIPGIGATAWAELQRDPEFPRAFWLSPRVKRHSERAVFAFLARRAQRVQSGGDAQRAVRAQRVTPAGQRADGSPAARRARAS